MKKQTKSFIKRVIFYLFLTCIISLPFFLAILLAWVTSFLIDDVVFVNNRLDRLNEFFCIICMYMPVCCYWTAKMSGIFKKLSEFNLEFRKEFLIVFIISTIVFVIYFLEFFFTAHEFDFDSLIFSVEISALYAYLLLFSFLLYKFFQYLTKKFPKPFNKIGYYSSIEFYKSLAAKIKNRFESKN